MVTERLWVEASSARYPIYISPDLEILLQEKLAYHLNGQTVIITNDTVAHFYLPMIEKVVQSLGQKAVCIVVKDGERYKNHTTLNEIYTQLLQHKIDRGATFLALGGGVIGDMVGFAAATYQRGVAFIQIPTTLLSQVDSSVGGKTAINHPLGKNMVGAFYQPKAVFIGQNVLTTLNQREFSAGMAEVIKYGLIQDKEFFRYLEKETSAIQALDTDTIRKIVFTACTIKKDIVAEDEKEHGKRALLNLGHTFAHVIEHEQGYGNWLHGEAVAAGLVLAARLSRELGLLENKEIARIKALIENFNLPSTPPSIEIEAWLEGFTQDKKVQNGQWRFVLLKAIGEAVVSAQVKETDLRKLLQGVMHEY